MRRDFPSLESVDFFKNMPIRSSNKSGIWAQKMESDHLAFPCADSMFLNLSPPLCIVTDRCGWFKFYEQAGKNGFVRSYGAVVPRRHCRHTLHAPLAPSVPPCGATLCSNAQYCPQTRNSCNKYLLLYFEFFLFFLFLIWSPKKRSVGSAAFKTMAPTATKEPVRSGKAVPGSAQILHPPTANRLEIFLGSCLLPSRHRCRLAREGEASKANHSSGNQEEKGEKQGEGRLVDKGICRR